MKKRYTIDFNPNGGKYAGSTSNKTYTQKYGTTVKPKVFNAIKLAVKEL